MQSIGQSIFLATMFTILGGALGAVMILFSASFVPRILNQLTPDIDEEKEIKAGNRAVAEYFGRLVSAIIIGMSIVISAAVIAGIHG